jgi:hypothetical protein
LLAHDCLDHHSIALFIGAIRAYHNVGATPVATADSLP